MTDAYGGRAALAALLAVLALAACRPEEQGRPLTYDKGTYQGAADSALPEATLDELRLRAKRQSYN